MYLIEKSEKGSVHFLFTDELHSKDETVEGLLQSLTSEVKGLKRKINKMMHAQKTICDHYKVQLDISSATESSEYSEDVV